MRHFEKLQELLSKAREEGVVLTSTDEFIQWNEDIEAVLFATPEDKAAADQDADNDENLENISKDSLDKVALQLQESILKLLCMVLDPRYESTKEHSGAEHTLPWVMDYLKKNEDSIPEKFKEKDDQHRLELECFIRTSSNFFRWYLQVYLEKCTLIHPLCSTLFHSPEMLTIIMYIIEQNAYMEDTEPPQNHLGELSPSQRLARYASLLLFYVTFSPQAPNDEAMEKTHEYLVSELDFIPRVLKILTYPSGISAALALSLIRSVHNLMVSFAGAVPALKQTFLKYDQAAAKAPWKPMKDDNTDGLITYPSIFRDILIWALNAPDLPAFPGSKDDRRADLVVEVLGIIFAMGGEDVTRALRYPSPNISLAQLVITALKSMDSSDSRCRQVQLSTITILMDANPTFATFLVEQDAVNNLFEITERQIDRIIDASQVESTAIAALVPSLAVLYKFSVGNPTFRDVTKEIVFPPSQEAHFQQLVQQHQEEAGAGAGVTAAKNMHPLDAPRGTLRWKLIRLMTWSESHIKRYASELLWALSEQDPKEFVFRTGLGNAMAFLGAKGMVQLPSHVHQG